MYGKYLNHYMYYDCLQHHGVKGMKWGVIREKVNGVWRVVKSAMADRSADRSKAKVAKKIKKSSARDLSKLNDEELKARINRLNLEKQYRELDVSSKSDIKKIGKKLFISAVEKVGTNTVDWAVNKLFNKDNGIKLSIDDLNKIDMSKVAPSFLSKAANVYTQYGVTQKIMKQMKDGWVQNK